MIDEPLTKAEAEKLRYGQWAGNERGYKYDPTRCAYDIYSNYFGRQCGHAPGYGPDNLYCKQHAKIVIKNLATVIQGRVSLLPPPPE